MEQKIPDRWLFIGVRVSVPPHHAGKALTDQGKPSRTARLDGGSRSVFASHGLDYFTESCGELCEFRFARHVDRTRRCRRFASPAVFVAPLLAQASCSVRTSASLATTPHAIVPTGHPVRTCFFQPSWHAPPIQFPRVISPELCMFRCDITRSEFD